MALDKRILQSLEVILGDKDAAYQIFNILDGVSKAGETITGDLSVTGNTTHTGTTLLSGLTTIAASLAAGANATDRATIKGFYMNPAVIAVAVPSIANDAAENVDSVAVDVSASFAIQPAVGDAVIPIPMAALPTDCLLCGASVTATDEITVVFGSKEAGGGVTGANKNFNFLVIDLT